MRLLVIAEKSARLARNLVGLEISVELMFMRLAGSTPINMNAAKLVARIIVPPYLPCAVATRPVRFA